ncbi:MAG: hypothetical protein ACT4OO_05060 [Nitrospiraceae bacterium]
MKHGMALSMTLILAGIVALSSESLGEVISSPSETVRGQIMKVEGQTYVVQDLSGKEIKLRVDSNTMMMDGTKLQEGDTITADVTAKGQATYIIPGPPPSDSKAIKGAASSSTEIERNSRLP